LASGVQGLHLSAAEKVLLKELPAWAVFRTTSKKRGTQVEDELVWGVGQEKKLGELHGTGVLLAREKRGGPICLR